MESLEVVSLAYPSTCNGRDGTVVCPDGEDKDINNENDDTKSLLSLIGGKDTFAQGRKEIRPPNRNLTYLPTHRWWEPPLGAWFPEVHREILYAVWIYNTTIVILIRFTNLCGKPSDVTGARFCSDDFMLHEDMDIAALSFGLFLLLSFRANQSYNRFWEARKAWGGIRKCLDFARLVCAHIKVESANDVLDRRRAIHFVAAYPVACKAHLRKERDIRRDFETLGLKLCHQDMANIQHAHHMPLFCQDVLSNYLNTQADEAGKLSQKQLDVINTTCLAVMSDALGTCERIADTPLPLSYVLLLRFFLIFWLLLFPLHSAEYYGWWSIASCNLIAYAVWGIESMVCEIEDPFGHGPNDLNLDAMVASLFKGTQAILRRAESKDKDLIFDRIQMEERGKENFGDGTNAG